MIKTDIILHPHKILLDSYFNTDTAKYLYGKTGLSPSETIALGTIIAAYHPQRIIRIPEVHIPKKIKTPDFLIDNIRYEVKSPESLSGVGDLANTARKQVKHCGFVVFEFMNAKGAPLCDFIDKAFNCCIQHKNVGFILMNHGDIIYSSIDQ
ncbi:hypothetical protein IK110_01070 [Candidatus Saccharibacteria bacterium]|nr:hypothetical protein [Candidatus Saccharibacteria bacterium]